ncbi:putative phage protein [Selenomonas ruminantium subsp. lactilytica TAM6421]|uniref:Putative phage protein n=1 Tax=Selenomonas ruminantium subsp. lactilytica (strain NBRC 103574 / TAM6421) TaxID=927704 RepID=I0GS07_SELRL|nr:DUF3310 domain-containing protein [Selenomonas ruminantium]BAL83544.1 putative phage protein [Selenomonas ruminantium subsp. lactilytica TAM6421]
MQDMKKVAHPSYYTKGGIEVYDVIKAYNLNFERGNACKYVLRAGEKDTNTEAEDCEKGAWYLIAHSARIKGCKRSEILKDMLERELQKEQ